MAALHERPGIDATPVAACSIARSSEVKRSWVTSCSRVRRISTSSRGPKRSVTSSWALHRRPRAMYARSMRSCWPSRQTPRTTTCACGCSVSWWLTAAHFDGPSEVGLDALHQLPDVAREVEIASVFRRHDESELVPLAEARLLEGLASRGALGTIEPTGRAVPFDAVALDVPQVPGSRLRAVPSELLHVRLDDNAAGAVPRTEAGGRRESRCPFAAEAPMTSTHERRDAKGARGDPLAGAITPADPRSEGVELVVGIAAVAHRKTRLHAARRRSSGGPYRDPKGPIISSSFQSIIRIRGLPFILPSVFDSGSNVSVCTSWTTRSCSRG